MQMLWREGEQCIQYHPTLKLNSLQFPKGRIDALVIHLTRKCPAIPHHDRQRAIAHFHPDITANQDAQQNGEEQPQSVQLPVHPASGLSALETLAEVSRHHLDYSAQYPPQKKRRITKGKSNGMNSDVSVGASAPAGYVAAEPIMGDLHGHQEQNNASQYDPAEFLVQDDGNEGRTDGNNADQDAQGGAENADLAESAMNAAYDSSNAPSVPVSLQFAASAATELIMPHNITSGPFQGYGDDNPDFLFTKFRSRAPPSANVIDPQLHDGSATTIERELSKAANRLRPLACKSPPPEAPLDAPKSKPKVRGRFSDSRRKEVQNMRKMGACMRCRMLKKPCSNETPCSQCTKIDSARVWRQPCIRTKIAEEFNLYSAGLFAIRAFQNSNRAKEILNFDVVIGRVEARIFPSNLLFATFDVRVGHSLTAATLQETNLEHGSAATPEVQMIATTDDVSVKLEEYIGKLAFDFYDSECSQIVGMGLAYARKIFTATQSVLIFRAVELEICTRLLCGELSFELFYNLTQPSQFAPVEIDLEMDNARHQQITPDSNKKTHELMASQMLAGVERRAAALSRNVMNELERRLLQRQQAHPFETFLISIILLSCVQRMCVLYKKLEDFLPTLPIAPDAALQGLEERLRAAAGPAHLEDEYKGEHSHAEPVEHFKEDQSDVVPPFAVRTHPVSSNPNGWPLDKPHSFYYNQGEHFSDILIMLLKLRNIIPATTVREEDGVIVVDDRIESQPIPPTDEAKEWFETMQLTEDRLGEMASQGGEMMYLSKILDKGWQNRT